MTKTTTCSVVLKDLCDAICGFPDITVLDARDGDPWSIYFRPQGEPTPNAYASIEFLVWLVRSHARPSVTIEVDAPPPFLNGPCLSLYFVLRGRNYSPWDLSSLIYRCRQELFFVPSDGVPTTGRSDLDVLGTD